MNKLIYKYLLSCVVLLTGSTLCFWLKSYLYSNLSAVAYIPYVILVLTYTLVGLLLDPIYSIRHRKLYCIFVIFIFVLLIFPFIFPSSLISLYLIETHIYIFLSLLMGRFIRLIFSQKLK